MQREAISEIEAARPKHLVFVNDPNSWLMRPESDMSIFLWMQGYVGAYYDRIGVVDILSKAETVYIWGNDAVAYQPRSRFFLLLFERKTDFEGKKPMEG